MSRFAIDVTSEGGWWMVHIPELGGLTQARYPGEVELMAREYIAVSTGTPSTRWLSTGVAARCDPWLADAGGRNSNGGGGGI
jgi:hypothetical protein